MGTQTSGGTRQHMILPNFPKNCMKFKEFGFGGGGRHVSKILLTRSTTNTNRLLLYENKEICCKHFDHSFYFKLCTITKNRICKLLNSQMCCSLAGECFNFTNWFEAPILFPGPAEVVVQSPCATNEEAAAIRYIYAKFDIQNNAPVI